jgi:hypothetical protein
MSRYDRPSHQIYMVLLKTGRLAGSVPGGRPEDPAAPEVDVHRPGEDPRAGQARGSMARLRESADAGARDRDGPRWSLLEAHARSVQEAKAVVTGRTRGPRIYR